MIILGVIFFALTQCVHHTIGVGADIDCYQKADGFYMNPFSCEEYFVCTLGRSYRFVCQDGQLYNPTTQKCDQPDSVHCFVVRPTSTHTASFSCVGKGDNFYPDPTACNQYYICANQTAIKATCSYGLLFSARKKYCDLYQRVLCMPGMRVPQFTTRSFNTNLPRHTTSIPRATTTVVTQKPTKAPLLTFPPVTTSPPHIVYTSSAYEGMCRSRPNSLVAIPGVCGQYIQCYFQLAMVRHCASGTVFNEAIQACDYSFNVPGCH